jgi:ketosteroid isomerase-like protein
VRKLLIVLWLGLTSTLAPVHAQTAADSASVAAFYQKWMSSASQGFTAYASFYAEDGYILPPGDPPAVLPEAQHWRESKIMKIANTDLPHDLGEAIGSAYRT